MRSLQRILRFWALGLSGCLLAPFTTSTVLAQAPSSLFPVSQQATSAQSLPESLFAIDLPAPSADQMREVALSDAELLTLSQQAMQILLLRLSGQSALQQAARTETLRQQARQWLRNYQYVPLLQDGVKVGVKLRFLFDEEALKPLLSQAQVKIWPTLMRPKMLVMGAVLENQTLTKLTQANLAFRPDIPLMALAHERAMPIQLPLSDQVWIYPLNPANNLMNLQEVLIQSEQQRLLSFQLSKRGPQQELSWYLFDNTGAVLTKGSVQGSQQTPLFEQMLNITMERLMEESRPLLETRDQVVLNVIGINGLAELEQARQLIQQALPNVSSMALQELKADRAQFKLDYLGDYANLQQMLRPLPQFTLISASEMLRQLDLQFQSNAPVAASPGIGPDVSTPEPPLSNNDNSMRSQP
ncbi:MAG: DUF2066 domain-containing protein [Thiotrichales bacterium]|nr:DUF2066 domain-containing protein [Thiotrichales bacterium]